MDNPADKHKQNISNIFSNASSTYGIVGPDFFDYFGKKLVDCANIKPGFAVLDVACGRGSSLFSAHKIIGTNGHITGIDLSPEMVKLTSADVESLGVKNISVFQMDAEELKFPDQSFDAVISGFSLFFLPDLQKCLGEIKRVLKKGGMFVTSTWAERDARWQPLRNLISSLQPAPADSRTKIIWLNNEAEIREQFTKAGFQKIEIYSEAKEFYYHDEEEWFRSIYSHGMRSIVENMDEPTLEIFKRDAFNFLSTIKNEKGIPEIFSVFITKVFKG